MAALEGVKEGGSVNEEQRKSVFGRYSDAEMLAQLKRLALNPCASALRQIDPPLWNQMLKLRDAMTLSDKGIYWVCLLFYDVSINIFTSIMVVYRLVLVELIIVLQICKIVINVQSYLIEIKYKMDYSRE